MWTEILFALGRRWLPLPSPATLLPVLLGGLTVGVLPLLLRFRFISTLTWAAAELLLSTGKLLLPVTLLLLINALSTKPFMITAAADERQQQPQVAPLLAASVIAGPLCIALLESLKAKMAAALLESLAALLGPATELLVPVVILLIIHFLSSGRATQMISRYFSASPDSIHRLSGSSVGIAIFLLILITMLYLRSSLSNADDSSDQ